MSQPKGYSPGPKTAYLLPELLSHKDVTSGNLGAGDKKNRELTFLFLGRVARLGFEYVVTQGIFCNLAFLR